MNWNVYLIHCSDGTLYCDVGKTQKVLANFTYLKDRVPYKVVHTRKFSRLSDAIGECFRIRSLKRSAKMRLIKT